MNSEQTDISDASILVVDDTRENLRLLGDILSGRGYHVRPAPNGLRALSAAQISPPDLILLDILMPEMSGFEVCEKLKADELTNDIPIIFVSAISEVVDKVKAFSIGGVDYITKPFQAEEVLARVETHLALIRLRKGLQDKNIRLQDEIAKRKQAEDVLRQKNKDIAHTLEELKTAQKQLIESEKMAALGGLVAGIAHEINTPIGVGVTAGSTLANKTEALLETYKSGELKGADLKAYLNNAERSTSLILSNLQRARELVQSFKQVAVDQTSLEIRSFSVKTYIEKTLVSLGPKLKQTSHQVTIDGSENLTIKSCPGAFSQIVTNLVMNSLVHAYPEGRPGHLHFYFYQEGEWLFFEYSDDGQGIPHEHAERVFEPFFTTARAKGGTGLGLHIIYNLVTQTLQGTIHCESSKGTGAKFILSLPIETGMK